MPSLIPLALSSPTQQKKLRMQSPWLLLANTTDYLGLGKAAEVDGTPCWQMNDGRVLPWDAVVYWTRLLEVAVHAGRTKIEPLHDDDGYPTSSALLALEKWPWHDPVGAFELARQLWTYPDRAVRHPDAPGVLARYSFSTAGWSGNESVIAALKRNSVLWATTWLSSGRGGWYEFQVKDD